jgi:MFS family permease
VLEAGLLTAVAPLTVAILAPFSGRLATRHGFRPFVIAGPLLLAVAMLLCRATLGADPEPLPLVLYSEIAALGIAAFIPVNAAAAVSELPPPRLSVGGAVNNTGRQVGSVLGVSLLVSVIGAGADIGDLVAGHRRGWMLIAAASVLAAAISTRQPTQRRELAPARPAGGERVRTPA